MQDAANGMNDATQPQHFTLRTFRVQAQSNNTPRPFLGPEPRGSAPVSELPGELQFRAVTPEPASAQL